MTRELLLMRHAKSSWRDVTLADFDRPLKGRGRRDSSRMAQLIRKQALIPDLVVSSPSQRTRQTLGLMVPALGISEKKVLWQSSLYHASLAELLRILAELSPEYQRIMLLGHNPGLEELVEFLAGPNWESVPSEKPFPTAALAHLVMPQSWHQLTRGCAQLKVLFRPKKLDSLGFLLVPK